jgi:hypothetical protein
VPPGESPIAVISSSSSSNSSSNILEAPSSPDRTLQVLNSVIIQEADNA